MFLFKKSIDRNSNFQMTFLFIFTIGIDKFILPTIALDVFIVFFSLYATINLKLNIIL